MAMKAVVCAVALMAVVVGCSAQLTATFPADDASIVAAATEALQGSLQDAYYGANVLSALGKQGEGSDACSSVQSALGAATALEDLFYGVNALRSLSCDVKLKKSAKAVVAEALDSDELDSLYFAALTAAAAKKKSLKVDWVRVVDAVGTLMDSGGTFRSNPEAKRSTAANAGRALSLLAASTKHVQGDADSMEILKTVTENVVSLLAREELEVAAAKLNKSKIPACQFYWNGRCPKGEACFLRHGEGHTRQTQLFTKNTDEMDYSELLDLGESMGVVPTPLDLSIKSRLPITASRPSESCPICIELFGSSGTLTELPCSHVFHQGCIYKWFDSNKACPICKKEVVLPPPRPTTPPKVGDHFWRLKRRLRSTANS